MESVVTPEMAQLVYDPWAVQVINNANATTMGMWGLLAFLLVAIILMQIIIINQTNKHENKDDKS